MPDEIITVDFRSEGAPASAAAGSYPIIPFGARLEGSARQRYSIRYVPGTMAVGSGSVTNIAFVRKATTSFNNAATGEHEFALPAGPTNNNMLLVIVATYRSGAAGAPGVSQVRNDFGDLFTQVGGGAYIAQFTGTFSSEFKLTMWHRQVDNVSFDDVVKVTITDGGSGRFLGLVVLEYSRANTSNPVSAQTKQAVDTSSGTNSHTVPNLTLNGTTGQAVVAAYLMDQSTGAVTPSAGYTVRYGSTGNFAFGGILHAVDQRDLSGVGPEAPTITTTNPPVHGYAAMAVALTR